ncbi:MAG: hypothetical protein ACLU99_03990 [Alphaproteobacteria bacterium]
MKSLFLEGLKVAKTYDVCTPKDSLVVYSVSFLPNKKIVTMLLHMSTPTAAK